MFPQIKNSPIPFYLHVKLAKQKPLTRLQKTEKWCSQYGVPPMIFWAHNDTHTLWRIRTTWSGSHIQMITRYNSGDTCTDNTVLALLLNKETWTNLDINGKTHVLDEHQRKLTSSATCILMLWGIKINQSHVMYIILHYNITY